MTTITYESPKIYIIVFDPEDVITTSNSLAGVETTPVSDNGGIWEKL